MKKVYLVLIFGLFLTVQLFSQGYKIEIKINGVSNQDIILGHHKATTEGLVPDDTVKTDKKGYAVFQGDKNLKQGMYFIFLPSKNYFDFIVGEDQKFKIENDTADLFANMKAKGSVENEIFADYHNFLVSEQTKISNLKKEFAQTKDPERKKEIRQEMNDISKSFDDYYNKVVKNHPDLFFTTFLKASRNVIVPDSITGQMEKYEYYKKHYFDNFDIGDRRLLYTPIYENKIDIYLDKVVFQIPDSLNKEIDIILSKVEHDEELYKYMLVHLFNKYAKSKLMIAENIYVHLADIYIEKATWAADSFKNELKTKIARKKNCLIGDQAKPLHLTIVPNDSSEIELLRDPLLEMKQKGLKIEKDKSRSFDEKVPELSQLIAEYMAFFPEDINLNEVEAEYIILWFMAPDCSHCKHETPLLYNDYVNKLKQKNVKVFCIFLEANTDNWAKFSNAIGNWFGFIQKHQMYEEGWYNLWNPFDNKRFKYDISSSPVLFLLDKNKKIVAKKIGYKQAIEIIEDMEKRK